MKLTVLIPAFNEEKTILKILKRLEETKDKSVNYEIIVINDGSTDNALGMLEENKKLLISLDTLNTKIEKNIIMIMIKKLSVLY